MAQSRGLTGINAPGWWHNLILNKDGHPARGKLENVAIPFEQDPDFQDKFWFDVFQMKILVNGALPWRPYPPRGLWELQKGDELEAWRWLEQQGISTSHQLTLHGIAAAAYKHQFNPVLDYLNSLVWDGVPRLDTWAIDYLGAADTKYVRAVSAKWMIAAIARVEDPGCQADNALVLEGEQGHVRRGKSSALNVLGQPWYTDQLDADLSHKDASEQVVGVWIVELGELEAMIRSSPAAIKAFITRRKGRFRWSYDPAIREYPRQCVFAGTVNDQSWNRDPTGNRRFWPIWCTIIDVPGLELARDQLWAEAHHRYVRGEKHFLDEPALVVEAREEQELRYLQDPWEETIAKFLREKVADHRENRSGDVFRNVASMSELLNAVSVDFNKQSAREQTRVANILKRQAWTKKRVPFDKYGQVCELMDTASERKWRYVPPMYDPKTRTLNPQSDLNPEKSDLLSYQEDEE